MVFIGKIFGKKQQPTPSPASIPAARRGDRGMMLLPIKPVESAFKYNNRQILDCFLILGIVFS
jgi:predicted pyridoxine 5'-phosphate oxidase superfamily flavin-nucleotide-binding protein